MADQVTNYQCPKCTGPLRYDGPSGKLVCDYCGSTFDVQEIEALYAEKEQKAAEAGQKTAAGESREERDAGNTSAHDENGWDTSDVQKNWEEETKGFQTYTCPSCGAELVCDASTVATSCPYCGNPNVIPGKLSGVLKPDYILPFKLSKETAIEKLKEFYKGKPFLPGNFARSNQIEKIQGVYVPFWMFDGKAEGSATFEATNTQVFREGDYQVTRTQHFHVYRAGKIQFDKLPVDASSKMPDDHMDSIEPFNYKDLKPFSTAYMPGFLADKYDVSIEDCSKRADLRAQNTLFLELENSVSGYMTVTRTGGNCNLQRGKVHYALMPVWMLSTKWNGKNFLFAVNGQTGRLAGDLPVSWGRFFGMFAGLSVLFAGIFALLVYLI